MMSEGNSLRAITRMTGASINTVTKLLENLGNACAKFHNEHVQNVTAKRIEADEVWTFCYARRDNVPEEKRGTLGYGDVWTWVGLDSDSKLVVSWTCGRRDADTAYEFMHDLAGRLANRVQLTTDGLHAYLVATDAEFGTDIDYARLIKVYGLDERPFKEAGEPLARARDSLRSLQLRAQAEGLEGHARDGRRTRGSRLVHRGDHRPAGPR